MTSTPKDRGATAARQIRTELRPAVASGLAYAQAVGTAEGEELLTNYWQQWTEEERRLAFLESVVATRVFIEAHPDFTQALASSLAEVLSDDLTLAELDEQLDDSGEGASAGW